MGEYYSNNKGDFKKSGGSYKPVSVKPQTQEQIIAQAERRAAIEADRIAKSKQAAVSPDQQQKRRRLINQNITGNKGIIGSMLALGGSQLLGGGSNSGRVG